MKKSSKLIRSLVGNRFFGVKFIKRTDNSVRTMLCKLGVDVSVAAGPVGRDAEAKIGPDTAFLVYSKAKGLYGGISLEGGIITQDNKANKKFYGKEVTVKEIFKGEVDVPEEANVLIKTLDKYCN